MGLHGLRGTATVTFVQVVMVWGWSQGAHSSSFPFSPCEVISATDMIGAFWLGIKAGSPMVLE